MRCSLPISILALSFLLGACGRDGTNEDADLADTTLRRAEEVLAPGTPAFNVVNLLYASGNRSVEIAGRPTVAIKGGVGVALLVNGGVAIDVYEFETPEKRAAAQGSIAADGKTIGGATIAWDAPPHFFSTDRSIIIYRGNDAGSVATLQKQFGDPFAGQ